MKNKKAKTFNVWVRRVHTFTAIIEADSLEEALASANAMSESELLDVPGDTIDSEYEITGVLKS